MTKVKTAMSYRLVSAFDTRFLIPQKFNCKNILIPAAN